MENKYIHDAFEQFHAQDYERAENSLRRAMEIEPEYPEPRAHLANLLRLRNRMDEAIPILQPLADKPGIPPEYRWLLFEAHRAAGDVLQACQIAKKLEDNPHIIEEHRREIVDCARQSGNWSLALHFCRPEEDRDLIMEIRKVARACRILRLLPPILRRGLAGFAVRRFQRRAQWRNARAVLEAAAIADPHESAWPRRLAQLFRRTRDVYDPKWDREWNWYQVALRINPYDREVANGALRTLFDMQRWPEALQRLNRISPEHTFEPLPLLKAACLANIGKLEDADDLYAEMEGEKQAVSARFCRSLIALEEGRWDDAIRLLVGKTDEEGLDVLVDFFRGVARQLSAGRSIEDIDGQVFLDKMTGASPIETRATGSDVGQGCFLCGWQGLRVVLWRDRTTGWGRARCPQCSMISVNPLPSPEELNRLYDHEDRKDLSVIRIYRQALLDIVNASAEACRELPAYREITDWGKDFCWDDFEDSISGEKRCLDVGCSAGRIVEMFRRCGWRAEGTDVDPQAVAFGRSKGLDLSLGTVETIESAPAQYHLITLIDVIEHVPDPSSLVRKSMELLRPGGLLYVKTPASDSLPHRFVGDRWLDSAEHLHFFSRRTLQHLLTQTGFEILSHRQRTEPTTPFLHRELWQDRLYPELLIKWIDRLRAGDVIMFLARKPL
ncbi:MAG: methyltransferase domain-containing protein [bacterium]